MARVDKLMWPISTALENSSRFPVLSVVNIWAIFQETDQLEKEDAKEIPARGQDKNWQQAVSSGVADCLLPAAD